jgi:hypothetical protein
MIKPVGKATSSKAQSFLIDGEAIVCPGRMVCQTSTR